MMSCIIPYKIVLVLRSAIEMKFFQKTPCLKADFKVYRYVEDTIKHKLVHVFYLHHLC